MAKRSAGMGTPGEDMPASFDKLRTGLRLGMPRAAFQCYSEFWFLNSGYLNSYTHFALAKEWLRPTGGRSSLSSVVGRSGCLEVGEGCSTI